MTEPAATFSPRMVDALVDAVFIVEDQGHVLYANPALGQLLGWPIERLFGEPFVTLVPEHLRFEYSGKFHQIMETRTAEAERRTSPNDPALRRWIRIAGRGGHISGGPSGRSPPAYCRGVGREKQNRY